MIAFTSTVVGLGCIAFGSINSLNGIDKSNEYWELKVVIGWWTFESE